MKLRPFLKLSDSKQNVTKITFLVQNTPKKMASGGLPPQHILPPPRGRTPGATSDVAQNLSDEEIAKRWLEVSERNRQKVVN